MFVGGLSATTTAADVKAYFEQFGPVRHAFCCRSASLNPLIGTLKPQSNGPLNNSTVIGTLTIDG